MLIGISKLSASDAHPLSYFSLDGWGNFQSEAWSDLQLIAKKCHIVGNGQPNDCSDRTDEHRVIITTKIVFLNRDDIKGGIFKDPSVVTWKMIDLRLSA